MDNFRNDDHDLLITIANDTKWIKDWALNHEKEDSAMHATMKQAVQKAHERIDGAQRNLLYVALGGILSVSVLAITLMVK